jgi:hypothetical protein
VEERSSYDPYALVESDDAGLGAHTTPAGGLRSFAGQQQEVGLAWPYSCFRQLLGICRAAVPFNRQHAV